MAVKKKQKDGASVTERDIPDTNMEALDAFIDSGSVETKPYQKQRNHSERGGFGHLFQKEPAAPRRIPMSFTLDPEVLDLIEKTADLHRVSRSQVVEKIMREALS